jgi:hypothetical protein
LQAFLRPLRVLLDMARECPFANCDAQRAHGYDESRPI